MLEKIERYQILLLAIILGIAGIIGVCIITNAISNDSIFVTGSYSQNVTSDNGSFEIRVNSRKATKALSYSDLNKQIPLITEYLKKQGFKDDEIEVKSSYGYDVYEITPNGSSTNRTIAYDATRTINVRSKDVEKIKKASTDIINLNSDKINISVNEPSYFYSKLSDLKVKMLQEASKDAKMRAEAMLKATHNRVGKVKSVQMGVFQITPVDSTDVSDSGISDTSSIVKKVTSVANVRFRIK